MTLTLVLLLLGGLLLVFIALNALQQFKAKQESDRRLHLAKHKAIINETEEVLATANKLPLTKELVLIFQRRIIDEARALVEQMNDSTTRQRLADAESQLTITEQNYQPITDSQYRVPTDEKQLVGLLNLIKRLRNILRSEHARGKVDIQSLNTELQALDRLQLKAEIEGLFTRVDTAYKAQQVGTARQYLERAELKLTMAKGYTDSYFESKREQMQKWKSQLIPQTGKSEETVLEEAKMDDIDLLFQPKRKW